MCLSLHSYTPDDLGMSSPGGLPFGKSKTQMRSKVGRAPGGGGGGAARCIKLESQEELESGAGPGFFQKLFLSQTLMKK